MSHLPSFERPLAFDEDYDHAVIHLVWDVDRKSQARTLLLGTVELLPIEVPPPLEIPETSEALNNAHFLYATARVLSASEGLEWFEAASRGRLVRPAADGSFPNVGDDAGVFTAVPADEEPPAPRLVTSSFRIPFSADWQSCARARHLVPRAFDPKTLWSREDIERATAWIQGHTHFDLRLFPEYWGSVHLIAPNPIFRQVHGRMECTNEITELVLGIDLRRGKSVDGLVFELEEHRPTGVGWVIRERVTAPIQRIRLPGYPESASERVYDDRRGLLYELDSFVFGVTFAGEIDLVTETRRVSVSDRAGGVEQYEVSLKGIRTSKFEVGTPRTGREGAARLWAAAADRERRNGGEGAQRWFRAQAVDATIELRKLVGVARRRVFVVDPYFEGDDLHRVLLAVHDPSVPIMVLAGSGHLKSRREDTGIEHGDFLAQRIAEALASGRMSPLEVRTMAGEPPVIHDRLLLVDDDMWMLGSSLNGYGQRGTLRVKVPYPEPVLTDVMIVWNEAKPFDTWLEERRQARST